MYFITKIERLAQPVGLSSNTMCGGSYNNNSEIPLEVNWISKKAGSNTDTAIGMRIYIRSIDGGIHVPSMSKKGKLIDDVFVAETTINSMSIYAFLKHTPILEDNFEGTFATINDIHKLLTGLSASKGTFKTHPRKSKDESICSTAKLQVSLFKYEPIGSNLWGYTNHVTSQTTILKFRHGQHQIHLELNGRVETDINIDIGRAVQHNINGKTAEEYLKALSTNQNICKYLEQYSLTKTQPSPALTFTANAYTESQNQCLNNTNELEHGLPPSSERPKPSK